MVVQQEVLIVSLDLSGNRIGETKILSDPFPVLADSQEPRLICAVTADPPSMGRVDMGGGIIQGGPVIFEFTISATLDGIDVLTQLRGLENFGVGQNLTPINPFIILSSHVINYSAEAFGEHELSFLVEDEFGSSATCSQKVYVNQIPPQLVSFEIIPDNISIPLGLPRVFRAIGTFSDLSEQDITDQVMWSSLTPAVAEISDLPGFKGQLSTIGIGPATISATLDQINDSTNVTVTAAEPVSIQVSPQNISLPLGRDQYFTARATYTDLSQGDITNSVTWGSSNTLAASVSNVIKGYLTTLSTGPTTVKATLGAISGNASVTVTVAELVSIEISPENFSLSPGSSEPFSVTGVFTDQGTEDITGSASWASSDVGVATISDSGPTKGLATGVDVGSTQITVHYGGFNDSTTLTVNYRQLYFFYTVAGDFDLTINDIVGTNHSFSDFDFKNQSFKIFIEERLLSRINYGGKNGYYQSDILATDNTTLDSHAEIYSITRHFADRDSTNSSPCTVVSDSVFINRRLDKQKMDSGGTFLNLSGQTAPVYLFKDELRDRWAVSYQRCYPTIHSSRRVGFGQVTSAPTFSGYPWASDGYDNSYGNGAYVYVDSQGDLHLRYETQTSHSRAVFIIGISANE